MERTKILLVDDEEIILKAYPLELESAGCIVRTASRGREAIDIVQKENIDIVYLDLRLPEMNGVEICRQIKNLSPDSEVVLVSGCPDYIERMQKDFIKAGGRDELLRKPLFENELVDITKQLWQEIKKRKVIEYGADKDIDN